ncbi:CTP synthase, partial [candidate division TM7 genomosp. GTL1]
CFVTKDGAETDLDLGHYERFLDVELKKDAATLAGRVLRDLINRERDGRFLGKTVQVVPHFTDAIQQEFEKSGVGSDVHIVEMGGTVGDYEGVAFLEAIREFSSRVGRENCLYVHVVYVPYIGASKEFKSKPAQNAVRDLRSFGVVPDMLVARADREPPASIASKLSLFGGVPSDAIVVLSNADTVYRVPLTLEEKSVGDFIAKRFQLETPPAEMTKWHDIVGRATADFEQTISIGIVAKYLDNEDTYFSVVEALRSAAWEQGVKLRYDWVSAEQLESHGITALSKYDGLLVPGGFGNRGIEGMILAADHALEHRIPYFGICLGLQVAVIAAARRGGQPDATTTEVQPDAEHDVVYIMEHQRGKEATGGTMRLGNYECVLTEGSLAAFTYGEPTIVERHRHRYEVNRRFEKEINYGGVKVTGTSPDGMLVEMIEGQDHPYFIATQAHPEFRSRPHRAHPLFTGLIRAAKQKKYNKRWGMDIQPANQAQPVSDDQELAKVLAGPDDTQAPAAPAEPAADNTTQSGLQFEESPVPPAAGASVAAPEPAVLPTPAPTPSPETPVAQTPSASPELDSIKKDALEELRPLVTKLDLPSDEKFDTLLLIIRER